jgi:hypothetical protein
MVCTLREMRARLFLDARVVDVPMAYRATFVMLSSLQSFFFKSLQHESCCSDHVEPQTPESTKRVMQ